MAEVSVPQLTAAAIEVLLLRYSRVFRSRPSSPAVGTSSAVPRTLQIIVEDVLAALLLLLLLCVPLPLARFPQYPLARSLRSLLFCLLGKSGLLPFTVGHHLRLLRHRHAG